MIARYFMFLLGLGLLATPLHAEDSPTDSIDETPIDEYDRDHWSFRPIEDPPVPTVSRKDWPETRIDHFILSRLEKKALLPAPRADRATLIRRIHFDLTGLPPTTRQLDRFLADTRPGAYARLVDSLMASPDYGRRWGQYWLDLARFAETDGFEHDKIRPTAWKYRDWVIDALNDDMPYDRFVRWQIAGDVLGPQSKESGSQESGSQGQGQVATAFCLSGPDMPDINSQEERKHVLMNEIASTVGSVFFSLQVGCAQCHDHMYDAISQADFYRLRAFFEPAVGLEKNKSVTTLRPGNERDATSHLMIRGDWRRKGASLKAAFPRIANPNETVVDGDDSGRRRVQLAQWLTRADHPLTARTIVNRVWQHHFGRGLSTTPSDFGVMGDEPSHPELLDYLARRLLARDWSLKHLHREIVLSAVYQTKSDRPQEEDRPAAVGAGEAWAAASQVDPENYLWSRFPRRRLDAESLRDAMFAVSGTLNLEAAGPGVQPPLPPEMIKTLKSGQWKTSPKKADHFRRSIYIFARRNLRYPFFATFDRPAANASCAVRQPSTTAVQSLLLFNSDTTMQASRRLADAIIASRPNDHRGQCIEIYRRLFSRTPEPAELDDCIAFYEQQTSMLRGDGDGDPSEEALIDLCRALLNTNQFIYVD